MKKLKIILSTFLAVIPINTSLLIKTALVGFSAAINSQNKVVLAKDPDNETGIRFGKAGDHENAIIYFTKAIENNADPHPDFYSNRAYSKLFIPDLEGALIDINIAIERTPLKRYHYIRSRVNLGLKDIEGFCNDALLVYDDYYSKNVKSIDEILDNCQPYMQP